MTEIYIPRPKMYADRIRGTLRVLQGAAMAGQPVLFSVACAIVGKVRGESAATVERSFNRHARGNEKLLAEAYAADRRTAKLGRKKFTKEQLGGKVAMAMLEESRITHAATLVSVTTLYSPGWAYQCGRKRKDGKPQGQLRLVSSRDTMAA